MAASHRYLASLSQTLRLHSSKLIQSYILVNNDALACNGGPNKLSQPSWIRTRTFSSCSFKATNVISKGKKNEAVSSRISAIPVRFQTADVTNTTQAIETSASKPDVTDLLDRTASVDEDELTEEEATRIIENYTDKEKYRLGKYKLLWLKGHNNGMPENMTNKNWLKVMKFKKTKQRLYYFRKLRKAERKKEKQMEKIMKAEKKENKDELQVDNVKHNHGAYEGQYLNLYHSIYTTRITKLQRNIIGCQSVMFGRPVVFDFALEEHFEKNAYYLRNIINDLYSANIAHVEPFHFHVAGICQKGYFEKGLNYFIDVHNEDICDIFPRENLVYLTPHSDNPLTFHADDIFVIAAKSFYSNPKPSRQLPKDVQRAEELGIKTSFLPVNKYIRHTLQNNPRFPALPVVKALLDYNYCRDWDTAMKHINNMLTQAEQIKQIVWLEMMEEKRQKKPFKHF